ncbi:pyruvate dehydrogenase complex dihydrolipoamide acetyltransferase [Chondrinema litorale]|uniref:pyruvate dehydrogenase complex dihydrolipoamide acetyltransferase n=1 Tax=Chondrinema litorale TaxID=2994555 RepID=UPI00254435BC|nr:pyruvate dehydrogenase complex dihydrolipoamide acetyltransferase [Chondrinema litorale]UZR92422.1 pyruvate dehydrogenase complex dihydrolipoamide acetyltransferase [Chondrinema litorale]
MAEVIRMPKMSDTMEEGVIASWLVKVGDKVSSGDILAEVETDKATMELENYEDGTILYIGPGEKDSVPVDGIIAVVGEEGEDYQSLLDGEGGSSNGEQKETATESAPEESTEEAPAAADIDTSGINAEVITMPKMSDTMEEGTIASWLVKVGDDVASGDILAEVETDKATMELENYTDGKVLYLAADAGSSVKVDGVIAIIGEEGADYKTLLEAQNSKASGGAAKKEEAPAPKQEKKEASTAKKEEAKPAPAVSSTSSSTSSEGGRVKASPLAKKLAEDKGFDISKIPGSGDHGRVIRRDVESYQPVAETATAAPTIGAAVPVGQESFTEEKVSQMRKVISKRLAESKFTAPHFYLTMEINMDKAIEARKGMNEISPVKISFNDIVLKACAAALKQHPDVNSSWLGDKIRKNQHVHIGVAVAIPDGLLVPVVRFADSKTLSQISAEVKDLGKKAKEKKLQPADWEGNTFTISNLGMFGIDEFTAIINPPDACILAIGGIKQTPIVKDGEIKIGNLMKVTMSCDHRVVDGAVGSAFLLTLKQLLEDPVRILV